MAGGPWARRGLAAAFRPGVTAARLDSDGEGRVQQTRNWQRSSSGGVSFGEVSAGTINNAGRDVNSYDNRQHDNYEFTTPEGEALSLMASGKGAGRAVMILGMLMSVAAFGLFAAGLFRFMKPGSGAMSAGSFTAPPSLLDPEVFGGVPLGAIGFALFVLGGVVSSIGLVMAKAARERRRNGGHWWTASISRRGRAGTVDNAVHGGIDTVHGGQPGGSPRLDARQVASLVRSLRAELDAARLPAATKDVVHGGDGAGAKVRRAGICSGTPAVS